jgi:hypothetical protein
MIADKGTPTLNMWCTVFIVIAAVILFMGIAGLLPF